MRKTTPYQATKRPQAIAQHPAQPSSCCIEREGSSRTLNLSRNACQITPLGSVLATQSGIARESEIPPLGISAHQSVKNRLPSVFSVKKNVSTADFASWKRMNTNRFTVENGGGHTLPSCFKMNGRVLRQQREDNLIGFRMERAEHEEKF